MQSLKQATVIAQHCLEKGHPRRPIPPVNVAHERLKSDHHLTRRSVLALPVLFTASVSSFPSIGSTQIPQGYRSYRDVLDGYEFLVKEDWLQVTSTGNDVAFRSRSQPDQNLFVNISSPSTSRFNRIEDVGKIDEIGQTLLRQYLTEFMSTRIGVVREGDVVSNSERAASDGKKYYDVAVVLRSYASRNQLAVTQEERQKQVELEWERTIFTVIGVANKRKYEFRLQANINAKLSDLEAIVTMAESFRCSTV